MVHVTFYQNTSDNRVVNKNIVALKSVEVNLKAETSTDKPTIYTGFDENLYKCNYIYIREFSRYYYVNRISLANQLMYFETSESDVLMSFKEQLFEINATIKRQSELYNTYLADSDILVYANSAVMLRKFPKSFDDFRDTYVLVTNGGSN